MGREEAWLGVAKRLLKDRFAVKKNVPPYLCPWTVIDTQTGNKVGGYTTEQFAKIACNNFIEFGLPNQREAHEKRIQRPMDRFVIEKNTLSCDHQWAIIDTTTGKMLYECETEKLAEESCRRDNSFIKLKIPNFPLDAYKKQIQQPDDDPLQKPPRHSNKRPVKLN